jgi:alpha-1,2-mannosyltransferase
MSWFRRIALVFSLASFLTFALTQALNWIHSPGENNLVGVTKSSDLFQHYAAGIFVKEDRLADLFLGGQLGEWIINLEPEKHTSKKSSFNYVYPPLVAYAASFCSSLEFLSFALGWLGFSVLAYLVATKLILSLNSSSSAVFWLILLLGLPSLHYTLILGQNSCLTFLIVAGAALFLSRRQEWIAGLIVSCLFYKPQFLPLLLGSMLVLGHWRMVIAAGAGSLFWLALGVLLCGGQSYVDWVTVLSNLNSGVQTQVTNLNQTLKMFLLHLMGQASSPGSISGPLSTLVGLSPLIACVLFLRFQSFDQRWSPAHSFLLICAVSTIASPYLMHYDMLLAAGWWLLQAQEHEQSPWETPLLAALFWIISLFSINMLNWPFPITAPLMLLYLFFTLRSYRTLRR